MRQFNYRNNLITTAQLITLAIKYSVIGLFYTSSMAVYGNGNPPFYENDSVYNFDHNSENNYTENAESFPFF